MSPEEFDIWVNMLLENSYDWKQIGISNKYCNNLSVPKHGIKLISWPDRAFEVTDAKKYLAYVLRYQ